MAFLNINDGRKQLYQWDSGRKATVSIDCDAVHFSNLKYGESLSVEVKDGKVEIPNKLLMNGTGIYCWAFFEDESGYYTKEEQTLQVEKRPKPSDYVYEETEILTIKTAVNEALKEAKDSGEFDGEDGLSAYEIYLKYHPEYTGTEDEWSNYFDKSIEEIKRDVRFLKLSNEGYTYTFWTDRATESIKVIPSSALRYAVFERVGGRTTNDLVSLSAAELNRIEIHGKNLVPPTFYGIANWDRSNGTWDRFVLPPIEKDGYYTFNAEKNPNVDWGTAILVLSISEDNGETWVFPNDWVNGYVLTNTIDRSPVTMYLKKGTLLRLGISPKGQETLDKIINVQLEHGEMATEYTPYIEPLIWDIPEAITSLPSFGHGISDTVCNYIDFEKKQYVQMCEWRYYQEGDENIEGALTDGARLFSVVPLANPIVTDISDYIPFDSTIEVEGNGFIKFAFYERFGENENLFLLLVPSILTYQLKL